jgi:glutathione peroxidase
VVVSGNQKAPLFKYLTEDSGETFKGSIDWNFEKFLIGKNGQVVGRFKSAVDPQSKELVSAISAAIGPKGGQTPKVSAPAAAKPDK